MDLSLIEGRLSIKGLSSVQLKKLYDKLRVDLLDNNIVHYRPVAFKMEGGLSNAVQSNVSKIPEFGYSFSEMSFLLDNIVLAEKRGIMPEALNASAVTTKLRSDCSFITLMGDTISTDVPESMFYCGEGIQSNLKTLLKDMTIFSKLKTPVAITVILMRGKHRKDFQDNQRLIFNTAGYKPMRTSYNLYDFFSIREYVRGDHIKLNYKHVINEDVLQIILKDYIEQEDVISCLK